MRSLFTAGLAVIGKTYTIQFFSTADARASVLIRSFIVLNSKSAVAYIRKTKKVFPEGSTSHFIYSFI